MAIFRAKSIVFMRTVFFFLLFGLLSQASFGNTPKDSLEKVLSLANLEDSTRVATLLGLADLYSSGSKGDSALLYFNLAINFSKSRGLQGNLKWVPLLLASERTLWSLWR